MTDVHIDPDLDESASSRRRFLKLGGAGAAMAAAAAAAGVIGGASRADAVGANIAVDGAFAGAGTTQLTDSQLKVIIDTGNKVAIWGSNIQSTALNNGVQGDGYVGVVGNGFAAGVQGNAVVSSAIGVSAVNTAGGVALQATSSTGPVARLVQTTPPAVMPPTSGAWNAGAIVVKGGHVWYCYQSGTGTASKWAKLSGTYIPLNTPVRAYNSVGHGKLAPGQQRVISLASGGVPAGASAALINLTVLNTEGKGGLKVFKTGGAVPGVSNISWFGANQVIANNATTRVDATAHITIQGGGFGKTDFIVDVFGFYP